MSGRGWVLTAVQRALVAAYVRQAGDQWEAEQMRSDVDSVLAGAADVWSANTVGTVLEDDRAARSAYVTLCLTDMQVQDPAAFLDTGDPA